MTWIAETFYAVQVGDKHHYRLLQPLIFVTKEGHRIMIKPGFITDGASIPKLLRWFASPFAGPHAPAAVLHDGLYRMHDLISRTWADDVFHQAMIESGVSKTKAGLMWWSVSKWGRSGWEQNYSQYGGSDSLVVINRSN